MRLIPQSNGEPLREFNKCHSPENGKFCSGWHLTADPDFTPNPAFKPDLNSLAGDMIEDGPAGLFVTDQPEFWMQAHGYERPYVAEVQGTVTNPPGAVMYKGREQFMQGSMKTLRVLTIDEYARERFGGTGWVEDYDGTAPAKAPKGYKARSVAQMTPAEIAKWEQQFTAWTRRSR